MTISLDLISGLEPILAVFTVLGLILIIRWLVQIWP